MEKNTVTEIVELAKANKKLCIRVVGICAAAAILYKLGYRDGLKVGRMDIYANAIKESISAIASVDPETKAKLLLQLL